MNDARVSAYIIAARRTALGRVGGLHRLRRIEELAAPVVSAALADAKLEPGEVDEVIIGSTTQSGNPARLIALAAGLPDKVPAATIDRQCGSGLDAILAAVRAIALGEATVVVAGGADCISTAPWRVAKPKNVHQTPQFLRLDPAGSDDPDETPFHEAAEDLSRRLKISRAQQDAWTVRSHLRAETARAERRFVGEIVPLRGNPDEARDQSAVEPSPADLERMAPFVPPHGSLTPGNTAALHDGAAVVVVVSEDRWRELGEPPALRLGGSAIEGVAPSDDAGAPMAAMRKLFGRMPGFDRTQLALVELGETSAAQAIAFTNALGLDDDAVNPDGGSTVRGHACGAAGAILVVRLFTRMARSHGETAPRFGAAVIGAAGGIGMAALFERVPSTR